MKTLYPSPVANAQEISQGKVRHLYAARGDGLLFVHSDRVSTHNVVHQSEIPGKGRCLNWLVVFWNSKFQVRGIPSHLLAFGHGIYNHLNQTRSRLPSDLHLRSLVVRGAQVAPVEFIFRRYLAGSLHRNYQGGKSNPYGLVLQDGLRLMDRFGEPVFTPTSKSDNDEPLNARDVIRQFPRHYDLAKRAFEAAEDHLGWAGLTLVDAKFEIGILPDGRCVLVDEFVTPDCARLCRTEDVVVDQDPPWMDKQVVRDWVQRHNSDESGRVRSSVLPPQIVEQTSDLYADTFQKITGRSIDDFISDFAGQPV